MARAIVPIMAIIVLAVLLALMLLMGLGVEGWVEGEETGMKRGAVCRLGPLRVTISSSYDSRNASVTLVYTIQPPNPCYKLIGIGVNKSVLAGNVLRAVVDIRMEGPAEGTYCVQVLPSPTVSKVSIPAVSKPDTIELTTRLFLVKGDKTETHSCTVVIGDQH
ncbi:hypothetical protein PYJP_12190 [Pyrofollis japonicus]|uniref:hypothetical protein n=1 Tax=Pyrofollis japonicus TaxID=3060460 RepID=UPI00295B47B2|nr:hypothetical protein [Pyrofollis japonicus]BEP17867.1 hypothetical protein PYJP_12190 [Pyrofollis japonicus]